YTQPGGLVIVEDEAKLVRQLYAWAEEGISVRQMATRLGASGAKAPRGGPWSKPTITKLLRNPVYKGTFILGRLTSDKKQAAWVRVERPEAEWIRITVAPIVSTVTWEKAQSCFERNRSRLVGRPDKREYLLRGLLVCGLCGKRYVGGASRGRRVYRCSGRDRLLGEHRCLGSRELGADTVEHSVKAEITDMLNNPDRLLGAEQYQARQGARHGEVRHEAEEVARALRDCRARRARLLDLAIDGTVPKAVFSERDAPLAAEEERLARRADVLAKAAAGSAAQAARAKAVEAQARLLRSGLDRLDFAGWRRFLAILVDHIRVRPEALEVGVIFAPPAPAIEETPANSRARIGS